MSVSHSVSWLGKKTVHISWDDTLYPVCTNIYAESLIMKVLHWPVMWWQKRDARKVIEYFSYLFPRVLTIKFIYKWRVVHDGISDGSGMTALGPLLTKLQGHILTNFHEISRWRYWFRVVPLFWYLTGISAVLLLRHQSNFRVIRLF